jgi:hypothetical protein
VFPRFDLSIRPEAGMVVTFPSGHDFGAFSAAGQERDAICGGGVDGCRWYGSGTGHCVGAREKPVFGRPRRKPAVGKRLGLRSRGHLVVAPRCRFSVMRKALVRCPISLARRKTPKDILP